MWKEFKELYADGFRKEVLITTVIVAGACILINEVIR